MITRLEEIKNEVAKQNCSGQPWNALTAQAQNDLWPEVCERYATECCEASLKKASEEGYIHYPAGNNLNPCVDPKTINNKDNIVLL